MEGVDLLHGEVRAMKNLMRVELPFSLSPAVPSKTHCLCWCPFMPETEKERAKMETEKCCFDDVVINDGAYNPALLLAVTQNSMAEVMQVDQVMRNSCRSGQVSRGEDPVPQPGFPTVSGLSGTHGVHSGHGA